MGIDANASLQLQYLNSLHRNNTSKLPCLRPCSFMMQPANINSGQYHPASIIIILNVELELLILAYLPAEHLEKPGCGSKICYVFKELKKPHPQMLSFHFIRGFKNSFDYIFKKQYQINCLKSQRGIIFFLNMIFQWWLFQQSCIKTGLLVNKYLPSLLEWYSRVLPILC